MEQPDHTVTQVIYCNWIETDLAPFMSRQGLHLVGTNGRLDLSQDNKCFIAY